MKKVKILMIIFLAMCLFLSEIPLHVAAEENAPDEEYEEWQSESDNYTEDRVDISISIIGAESVEIRIADSEDWERVSDGSSIKAVRANSIEIKGMEGYWLSAAYGESKSEAENSPAATVSENAGENTSVGVDNDGYIHIKAATTQTEAAGSSVEGVEDSSGNVTWNEVSNTQADSGAAKSTSSYQVGQKFYGKATAISRVPRDGGSTITFRHDNGWIKNETKVKSITAVCISGHTRGLSYVGAVFNYVATIKEVIGNRIKIQVVYYPRKNKPNTWYGSMAPKAQIMARTLWVTQHEHTGFVCLKKRPGNSKMNFLNECPNNYSLNKAVYNLYTDSACSVRAKDTDGNNVVFTTDSSGSSNIAELELGGDSKSFWAKEITASRGYKTDASVLSVTVTAGNTSDNPAVINSSEPPAMGLPDFKVYKLDPTGKYGWNKLRNAEYKISYYDVVNKDDIGSAKPKRSWVFTTEKIEEKDVRNGYRAGFDWRTDGVSEESDDFYMENGLRILPCGWFTIQEIKAPSGLALNTGISFGHIYQPANGVNAVVDIEDARTAEDKELEVVSEDSPQGVKLIIDKKDASTGKNIARESIKSHSFTRLSRYASLAGAEYEVYYDDNDLQSPELVGRIVTDEKGHGELGTRTLGDERFIGEKLPVGSYLIKESKAPPGYVIDKYHLSGNTQQVRADEKTEVICGYDAEGIAVKKIIGGQYTNGCHVFRTRAEFTDTAVFEYTVGSDEEPSRTYITKSDVTTGKHLPGARLQIISLNEEDNGTVVEEWISTDEDHLVWALPSGKYLLRETSAPYGYDTAEDAEFEIRENVIVSRVKMENRPVELSTNALSKADGTHHGLGAENEIITDNVKISGLYKGRSYKIAGRLVDKKTGKTLTGYDGKDANAEKEFTASGESETVDLEFAVDSSSFNRENYAVCFEKLYRVDSEITEIAGHEDINSASQTICYGGIIGTKAADSKGKTKNIVSNATCVIKDYVDYRGLSIKEEYTLEAELYDKTEGRLTGITASLNFVPEAADGTAEVTFRFNAEGLEGHTLVVFETLRLNGRFISDHKNPDDSDQTVYIKEKKGPDTGDRGILLAWISITALTGLLLLLMIVKRYLTQKKEEL